MKKDKDKEALTENFYHRYQALEERYQAYMRALGVVTPGQPFDLALLNALWQLSEEATRSLVKDLGQAGWLKPFPARDERWSRTKSKSNQKSRP